MKHQPPWIWPRAAYVHVPFCAHHCCYCDFAVATGQDHLIDTYLDALAREMEMLLVEPQPVRSIFLGGGTPTHLNEAQLARMLASIRTWLVLDKQGEFSIEANPKGLTAEKIAVLAEHGVNRLSLGAQSFEPGLLRVLERDHGPAQVGQAIELAKARIPEVSLDLIFGVPGQSLDQWFADLDTALGWPIDHISTYGLTYEKGTRLFGQRQRGEVVPVDEDLELLMYSQGIRRLESARFEHYEISNFARPGKRCRHNETYWANEAYFGFGMGAARYVKGRRDLNTRVLKEYLKRILAGQSAVAESETLPPLERARETMAVQLRRSEGISHLQFAEQTGFRLDEVASMKLPNLIKMGVLQDDGERLSLSRQGKYVADRVIEELL